MQDHSDRNLIQSKAIYWYLWASSARCQLMQHVDYPAIWGQQEHSLTRSAHEIMISEVNGERT
jgi:hypothetical protein